MAAELTLSDVDRIAALAHLHLTDEERTLFRRQLTEIVAYAEQLNAIDTSGVEATASVSTAARERDDEPRPSLAVEAAVRNAPDAAVEAGLFRVPRVIGG